MRLQPWCSNTQPYIYVTYIIGYYNPSVRIIDLVSHTTYVVYVNFIHMWRELQSKVDSEQLIFFWENFSWPISIYCQSFCQKSAEMKSPKKYFFFIFRFDAWPGVWTRALRLILTETSEESSHFNYLFFHSKLINFDLTFFKLFSCIHFIRWKVWLFNGIFVLFIYLKIHFNCVPCN